ncbi:Phosphoribosylaminoimidazole carboxylase [Xylona heveae TC161]|uniref:Phosphoribosylaminoimidazole carboxylase n=1 Tax=Xylona heveae (strain CBS 132557 / TC161) TaxID=1328760 RepID=A0A165II25_XYLHT|nr:Phosphoribosylaminoimidazole carboxylase [Xylona heveae TC161]KZF24931.1 Phosphoribosylaminoimidazole carboxylase [Xylona heveae TC161]
MDKRTIGVLGGGQLGRMLIEAAHRLNLKVVVLDAENSPAKQINHPHINGSFADPDAIRKLSKECDIVTVEIEHVNTHILEEVAKERGDAIQIQPSWKTIRVIQDKYLQKEHLLEQGVETAESIPIAHNTEEELKKVGEKLGFPYMLKSRTQAYDGRGNFPVESAADVPAALEALGKRPLYAERWANFKAELAVMVAKTKEDASADAWEQSTLAFPTVETVHEESICKLVYAPARNVSERLAQQAQILARRAVAGFWGKGVFGVEMFLGQDGNLLINEIAPRPHNSGHYTIEACPVSQYDAHLRAILDLPFPIDGTQMNTPDTSAIMLNFLGGADPDSHLTVAREALVTPGASIHLYGKGDARPGRKMGHVTVLAGSMTEAEKRITPLIDAVDRVRAARKDPSKKPQAAGSVATQQPKSTQAPPLVAVTMGSDSDLPVLKPGIALLREFNIPFEVTITSAHRTPGRMFAFAQEAAARGIKAIIAAAGGAAHLPGMVAASTPLPVIGVPVKGSTLDGMDSLLSIVQMPRGIPVATVAINNSINAALLAIRIIGSSDVAVLQKMEKYMKDMENGVYEKVDKLGNVGWEDYPGKA